MAFDLNSLPAYYVGKYGLPKIATVLGKSPSIVAMWQSKSKFPLDAVSRLLDFDPEPLATIKPLYTNPEPGKKLAIIMPCIGAPTPKAVDCLMKLYDPREMAFHRVAFNNLSVARASGAAWFLRGPFDWSYWMDADMITPCGDGAWYKEASGLHDMPEAFANINSIFRSLWHKKTIVSCSYVSKSLPAVPQFGGGGLPEFANLVSKGPVNRLIERPWAGMGGMLVHRNVFEDIIATQGNEIRMKPDGIGSPKRFNYEYAFFQPMDCEVCGDDVPFCIRAARAGHKTYVDLAIQAAHVGDRAYTYNDIAA